MRRIVTATMAGAALMLLAGCGDRQQLRPVTGKTLPLKPALATAIPTPDKLLAVPTQIQPGRSDELLTKSEERRDDRFSLPPP